MININTHRICLPHPILAAPKQSQKVQLSQLTHQRDTSKTHSHRFSTSSQFLFLMLNKQQGKVPLKTSYLPRKHSTQRASLSSDKRQGKNQQQRHVVKEIEQLKLPLEVNQRHQRFSNTITQHTQYKKSWKHSILRRKNNGAQGIIITGLSTHKHSLVLQKAEHLSNSTPNHKQQQPLQIPPDEAISFQPYGTAKESHNHSKTNKREHFQRIRVKFQLQKSIDDNIAQKQLINGRCLRTLPDERQKDRERSDRKGRTNSLIANKSLCHSQKISMVLSPWDI